MEETALVILKQYGLPGLAILGLWLLLQAEKKLNSDREQVWLKREELWHQTERQEREVLLKTIERNTEVLAQIQARERDRHEQTP